MLKLCRAEFAKQAESFDVAKQAAGTVWERNAAEEFGSTVHRMVSDIDATLRDWA
jgi:hypothetical protein